MGARPAPTLNRGSTALRVLPSRGLVEGTGQPQTSPGATENTEPQLGPPPRNAGRWSRSESAPRTAEKGLLEGVQALTEGGPFPLGLEVGEWEQEEPTCRW